MSSKFWVQPSDVRRIEGMADDAARRTPHPLLVRARGTRRLIMGAQVLGGAAGFAGVVPLAMVGGLVGESLFGGIGSVFGGLFGGFGSLFGVTAFAAALGNGFRFRVAERALKELEDPQLGAVGHGSSVALPSGMRDQ